MPTDVNAVRVRAIRDLSTRPYWQSLPTYEKTREVDRVARQLAMAESPIGQLAGLLARKADELADALDLFLASYPESVAAVVATRDALRHAGVANDPEGRGDEHFARTPEVARHLLFMLQEMILPQLDHCDLAEEVGGPVIAGAVRGRVTE